jgi:hypothetical protein
VGTILAALTLAGNASKSAGRMWYRHLMLCSTLVMCTGSRAFVSASWGAAARAGGVRALRGSGEERAGNDPLQVLLVRHGESEVIDLRSIAVWLVEVCLDAVCSKSCPAALYRRTKRGSS